MRVPVLSSAVDVTSLNECFPLAFEGSHLLCFDPAGDRHLQVTSNGWTENDDTLLVARSVVGFCASRGYVVWEIGPSALDTGLASRRFGDVAAAAEALRDLDTSGSGVRVVVLIVGTDSVLFPSMEPTVERTEFNTARLMLSTSLYSLAERDHPARVSVVGASLYESGQPWRSDCPEWSRFGVRVDVRDVVEGGIFDAR